MTVMAGPARRAARASLPQRAQPASGSATGESSSGRLAGRSQWNLMWPQPSELLAAIGTGMPLLLSLVNLKLTRKSARLAAARRFARPVGRSPHH
jgi:hypothetical protein